MEQHVCPSIRTDSVSEWYLIDTQCVCVAPHRYLLDTHEWEVLEDRMILDDPEVLSIEASSTLASDIPKFTLNTPRPRSHPSNHNPFEPSPILITLHVFPTDTPSARPRTVPS